MISCARFSGLTAPPRRWPPGPPEVPRPGVARDDPVELVLWARAGKAKRGSAAAAQSAERRNCFIITTTPRRAEVARIFATFRAVLLKECPVLWIQPKGLPDRSRGQRPRNTVPATDAPRQGCRIGWITQTARRIRSCAGAKIPGTPRCEARQHFRRAWSIPPARLRLPDVGVKSASA